MKALSLKQPFAELVVLGKKTIELRKWNTHFRGRFLIHASKIPDEKSMKMGFFFKKRNYSGRKIKIDNLPCGVIVGKAELVDVKKYKNEMEFNKDKNKHLATKKWGRYGFILKNVKRIKPIPAKGKLNFWEFKIK